MLQPEFSHHMSQQGKLSSVFLSRGLIDAKEDHVFDPANYHLCNKLTNGVYLIGLLL